MAEIGRTLGEQRLQDFIHVKAVAAELKVNPETVKRWLKKKKVKEVVWGRDRRGWVFIHRDSMKYLRAYRDAVKLS